MVCIFEDFDDFAGFGRRVVGAEQRPREGDARDARGEQGVDVAGRDAADGHDRKRNAALTALRGDAAVALEPEDRAQVPFGLGEAEGAEADVVGTLRGRTDDVVEGVGRGADDLPGAQQGAGLAGRHVVLAEVDAVGPEFGNQMHAVVEQERRAVCAAQSAHLTACAQELVVRSLLHAELHPAAAPLEHGPRAVDLVAAVGMVCDELQHDFR